MAQQTEILWDDESYGAAQELAEHLGCSMPEAVRRAVAWHHDEVFGARSPVSEVRAVRDELSRKLGQMSHEEQRRYIAEQLARPEDQPSDNPPRNSR